MSNQQNQDTLSTGLNKPLMLGYAVRPIGDGTKSSWSKIAAAWAHKDGQGYEVRMDAMPVDGRLVLRMVPEGDPPDSNVVDPTPE